MTLGEGQLTKNPVRLEDPLLTK